MVCLMSSEITVSKPDWPWECLGLFEMHRDLALLGGRIVSPDGTTLDGGRFLGFGRGCDCPDKGRAKGDFGYQAQLWKQRSVSAVPSRFCVFDASFLRSFLETSGFVQHGKIQAIGSWAGAYARRRGKRVVYSPFIEAVSAGSCDEQLTDFDIATFVTMN